MLVLTRKPNERIKIGNDVTVEVLGIAGGKVSLGIVAPDELRITREEIIDKPRREIKVA